MATNEHDIEILNDLIEVTLDSAHAYEDASADSTHLRFKTLFGKHAIERKQIAAELQTEVRRLLGGTPAKSGTLIGKAHRSIMNIKAAITGSEEGLVNSIEAAEDHIKAAYEKAMQDDRLSGPAFNLISRFFVPIKAGHDEMRAIKQEQTA